MLSGLKESLPLEAEYDALRRHEAISLALLLLYWRTLAAEDVDTASLLSRREGIAA